MDGRLQFIREVGIEGVPNACTINNWGQNWDKKILIFHTIHSTWKNFQCSDSSCIQPHVLRQVKSAQLELVEVGVIWKKLQKKFMYVNCQQWSKAVFSFQLMTSNAVYSRENLAADFLSVYNICDSSRGFNWAPFLMPTCHWMPLETHAFSAHVCLCHTGSNPL